jgi:uncharacterized C2H2 Zn-finger protein
MSDLFDVFDELTDTDLAGAHMNMDREQLRATLFDYLTRQKITPAVEETDGDETYYVCPRCGIAEHFKFLYCPWCGQHLKGKL